jgi:hypothetical protein
VLREVGLEGERKRERAMEMERRIGKDVESGNGDHGKQGTLLNHF